MLPISSEESKTILAAISVASEFSLLHVGINAICKILTASKLAFAAFGDWIQEREVLEKELEKNKVPYVILSKEQWPDFLFSDKVCGMCAVSTVEYLPGPDLRAKIETAIECMQILKDRQSSGVGSPNFIAGKGATAASTTSGSTTHNYYLRSIPALESGFGLLKLQPGLDSIVDSVLVELHVHPCVTAEMILNAARSFSEKSSKYLLSENEVPEKRLFRLDRASLMNYCRPFVQSSGRWNKHSIPECIFLASSDSGKTTLIGALKEYLRSSFCSDFAECSPTTILLFMEHPRSIQEAILGDFLDMEPALLSVIIVAAAKFSLNIDGLTELFRLFSKQKVSETLIRDFCDTIATDNRRGMHIFFLFEETVWFRCNDQGHDDSFCEDSSGASTGILFGDQGIKPPKNKCFPSSPRTSENPTEHLEQVWLCVRKLLDHVYMTCSGGAIITSGNNIFPFDEVKQTCDRLGYTFYKSTTDRPFVFESLPIYKDDDSFKRYLLGASESLLKDSALHASTDQLTLSCMAEISAAVAFCISRVSLREMWKWLDEMPKLPLEDFSNHVYCSMESATTVKSPLANATLRSVPCGLTFAVLCKVKVLTAYQSVRGAFRSRLIRVGFGDIRELDSFVPRVSFGDLMRLLLADPRAPDANRELKTLNECFALLHEKLSLSPTSANSFKNGLHVEHCVYAIIVLRVHSYIQMILENPMRLAHHSRTFRELLVGKPAALSSFVSFRLGNIEPVLTVPRKLLIKRDYTLPMQSLLPLLAFPSDSCNVFVVHLPDQEGLDILVAVLHADRTERVAEFFCIEVKMRAFPSSIDSSVIPKSQNAFSAVDPIAKKFISDGCNVFLHMVMATVNANCDATSFKTDVLQIGFSSFSLWDLCAEDILQFPSLALLVPLGALTKSRHKDSITSALRKLAVFSRTLPDHSTGYQDQFS